MTYKSPQEVEKEFDDSDIAKYHPANEGAWEDTKELVKSFISEIRKADREAMVEDIISLLHHLKYDGLIGERVETYNRAIDDVTNLLKSKLNS